MTFEVTRSETGLRRYGSGGLREKHINDAEIKHTGAIPLQGFDHHYTRINEGTTPHNRRKPRASRAVRPAVLRSHRTKHDFLKTNALFEILVDLK